MGSSHAATLIAGIAVGVLIAGATHGASARSVPCTTPTIASSPTVATTPAAAGQGVRLIYRYAGDSKTDALGQSGEFKVRWTLHAVGARMGD